MESPCDLCARVSSRLNAEVAQRKNGIMRRGKRAMQRRGYHAPRGGPAVGKRGLPPKSGRQVKASTGPSPTDRWPNDRCRENDSQVLRTDLPHGPRPESADKRYCAPVNQGRGGCPRTRSRQVRRNGLLRQGTPNIWCNVEPYGRRRNASTVRCGTTLLQRALYRKMQLPGGSVQAGGLARAIK